MKIKIFLYPTVVALLFVPSVSLGSLDQKDKHAVPLSTVELFKKAQAAKTGKERDLFIDQMVFKINHSTSERIKRAPVQVLQQEDVATVAVAVIVDDKEAQKQDIEQAHGKEIPEAQEVKSLQATARATHTVSYSKPFQQSWCVTAVEKDDLSCNSLSGWPVVKYEESCGQQSVKERNVCAIVNNASTLNEQQLNVRTFVDAASKLIQQKKIQQNINDKKRFSGAMAVFFEQGLSLEEIKKRQSLSPEEMKEKKVLSFGAMREKRGFYAYLREISEYGELSVVHLRQNEYPCVLKELMEINFELFKRLFGKESCDGRFGMFRYNLVMSNPRIPLSIEAESVGIPLSIVAGADVKADVKTDIKLVCFPLDLDREKYKNVRLHLVRADRKYGIEVTWENVMPIAWDALGTPVTNPERSQDDTAQGDLDI